jgi:hypothetical protein
MQVSRERTRRRAVSNWATLACLKVPVSGGRRRGRVYAQSLIEALARTSDAAMHWDIGPRLVSHSSATATFSSGAPYHQASTCNRSWLAGW